VIGGERATPSHGFRWAASRCCNTGVNESAVSAHQEHGGRLASGWQAHLSVMVRYAARHWQTRSDPSAQPWSTYHRRRVVMPTECLLAMIASQPIEYKERLHGAFEKRYYMECTTILLFFI
jgi:hypothetical protein